MAARQLPHIVFEALANNMQYSIRPHDIRLVGGRCAASFGKYETEVAAGNLIRFFQAKGLWAEFDIAEFTDFCRRNDLINADKPGDQLLYGLTGAWFDDGTMNYRWSGTAYIVLQPNGKCVVTQEFINRCAGKKNVKKTWRPKRERDTHRPLR